MIETKRGDGTGDVGGRRLSEIRRLLAERDARAVWEEQLRLWDHPQGGFGVSCWLLPETDGPGLFLVYVIRRGDSVSLTVEVAAESNLIEDTFDSLDRLAKKGV